MLSLAASKRVLNCFGLRAYVEDVKILVWDHNRDGMLERASAAALGVKCAC